MSNVPSFLHNLDAAYQLHYHIALATKAKRPLFASDSARGVIRDGLSEVCDRHNYHLLDHAVAANGLYLLLSLRPEHRRLAGH